MRFARKKKHGVCPHRLADAQTHFIYYMIPAKKKYACVWWSFVLDGRVLNVTSYLFIRHA